MENILTRIKQFSENKNVTINALERLIGASKGVLSRALNQNTDIQSKWLTQIVENYPDINSEWLLTGKGSMLKTGELPSSEQCTACASTNTEERIQELKLTIETQRDLIHMLKEQLNKYKKVQPNT